MKKLVMLLVIVLVAVSCKTETKKDTSTKATKEEKFPEVPFTWLSTEYDEMVVFALTRDEITKYRSLFEKSIKSVRQAST